MNKTKIIMIDGFKPEYLKYAPYLNSLTKKNKWGELEMPPGHEGAMEVFFRGETNKLALFYKSKNSSLKFIKYFSWLDNFGKIGRFIIDSLINFSRLIKRFELFRTGNIPLKKLHKFEMCIKKPFYEGLPVKYFYIGELDKIGHKYGAKSKEMIDAIKNVDKKIYRMDFDIILSDHGMADITKKVSVPKTENCFLDGDMARYWGGEKELEKIKEKLPLKNGKIISWPDKSYGDLIFMANTGVLIHPNFWDGKKPSKAMHGYDGKHKDMKAIYILNKKGERENIKVKELYNILKGMIKNNGK